MLLRHLEVVFTALKSKGTERVQATSFPFADCCFSDAARFDFSRGPVACIRNKSRGDLDGRNDPLIPLTIIASQSSSLNRSLYDLGD